ncbi:RNA-binding protein 44 [Dissostichus eleginoides]|uniref:RNA-binding protein 44 n=1 Tax=Dissostichus eleginoides TaxID=100907 RepID=A0AAD9CH96_DISEL|nr:RNA-binding protein 44 [Dissostichus eleginoides]
MVPYWNQVIENKCPIVHRIFHLNRSIFELVESHNYLELNDQRLLQWYLCLNFEDRKIIQDGGGLHWFLVRHPALELSPHHVYVKHCHSVIPVLLTMTSNRPTHVSPSTSAIARTDLEMLPNARDPLPHLGYSSSGDGSQKRQHKETLHTEPLLHPKESYQTAFSNVDSIQMDGTEYNDRSVIQSDGQTIPPLVEESSTNEGCFEDQSNIFHSIMENDESILAYETSQDMKAHNNGLHSVDGEALAASSDTWKTAEKHISSTPRVTTCDVMVGTEMPLCTSADTQTTGPETADKHINTEVHMVDLESIVKAFTKLKEKEKSLARKLRKERECLQRAELSLLALQDSMCRQHCSTLNDSSAEGGLLAPQSSQELQKHDSSPSEDTACPDEQIRSVCQQSNNEEKQMKKENSEEKQTPAACKDVSTLEAWFDAEEDLQPAAAAETEPDPTVITTDQTSESGSKEVESSVLYVSNLPSNASECDVMQWFEKYHASEVSISALKNGLRVAIVMISGAQSAEAAVRELNGSSMHGHALHVEHINRARDKTQDQDQDQDQASGTVRGPESAQTQTSKSDSSSAGRKLISQPPLSSSLRARRVVCVSPTAKGTMVQENYSTMGGFNTLMTELLSATRASPGRESTTQL